ncbi:hypothetical protein FKP32DRAFT_1593264 [Trametes sanguinea]|nr:hypothetical protein FKP32DRAFT_1593264 [Trametes sanguinea]
MGPNPRKRRGGGARAGQLCSLPKMQKATAALKAPPGTFGCLQLMQNDTGALQLVEAKSWRPPAARTASMNHKQTAAALERKSPSPFNEPTLSHSVPHANYSGTDVSQPSSIGRCNPDEQYAIESSYTTVPLHPHNHRLEYCSSDSEDAGVHTNPSATNVTVAHARDFASLPLLDPLPHLSSLSPHGLQPMPGNDQPEDGFYVSTPTQAFPDMSLAHIQSPEPQKSSGTLSSAGGPVRSNRTRHRACPVPRSRDRPQVSDFYEL